MKNYAPLILLIASIFSVNCFAQRGERVRANANAKNTQLMSDIMSENELAVVSYHVEERINMAFGSSITTYDVSSLSLVGTNDLGKNNVRIVTPKYAKAKVKPVVVSIAQSKAAITKVVPTIAPIKIEPAAPREVKEKYVDIDKVSTYERILERGYKSEDMFRRVADRRFFAGDLTIAAKWYKELFLMNSNLDAVYYYRYAQSLKAINQTEKSKEMMRLFESKK